MGEEYVDLGFMQAVSQVLVGQSSTTLTLLKPHVDPKFFDVNYQSKELFPLIQMEHTARSREKGAVMDPYDKMYPKVGAVTKEQKEQCDKQLAFLSEEYGKLLSNPEIAKYKGIQTYFNGLKKVVDSARKGIDRYNYIKRIPGAERALGNADWRSEDRKTNKPYTAEEFDHMLVDMGVNEFNEMIDYRIDLAIEMDSKPLTAEEKKAYAQKIMALNENLIDNCQYQMRDEFEQKYRGFYENYDGMEGTVKGDRGYKRHIREYQEENQALQNGWDPVRLADYMVIKEVADLSKECADGLAELNDPGAAELKTGVDKLAQLDPAGRVFKDQTEFDRYMVQFSTALEQLNEKALQPENQKKLHELYGTKGFKPTLLGNFRLGPKEKTNNTIERYRVISKKTDVRRERNAEVLPERKAELDKLDVAAFDDGVTDIQKQAKEKLAHFKKDLDGLRKQNSEHYMKMRNALEALANLPENYSPADAKKAIDNLAKASEAYTKKRSGLFKSSSGQARLDAAADLTKFAREASAGVEKLSVRVVKENPDLQIKKALNMDAKHMFTTLEEERRAGVDSDLNQQIADAMDLDNEPAGKDSFGKLKDRLQKDFANQSRKEFHGVGGNNDALQDDYTHSMARCIAYASVSIEMKKGKELPHPELSVEQGAKEIEKSALFKAMAKEAKENTAVRNELSQMSPGELLAKLAMRKQNAKMREAAPKKEAPNKQMAKEEKKHVYKH